MVALEKSKWPAVDVKGMGIAGRSLTNLAEK